MAIVESCVDTCPEGFILQLTNVVVSMRGLGGGAAHSEFHVRGPKEGFDGLGYRAGSATMCCGEFRMGRGRRKRQPCGIGYGVRISINIAVGNGSDWAPKTKVVFGIPATDSAVGEGD